MDSETREKKLGLIRQYGSYVTGSVLLAIVGSAVYDTLAKPGLNWLGTNLLALFSLLSGSLRDLPYAAAGLNPEPLPSLLTLLFVAVIGVAMLAFVCGMFSGRLRLQKRTKFEDVGKASAAQRQRLQSGLIVSSVYLFLSFIGSLMTFQIVNKALTIHRVFGANMEILAPYIDSSQLAKLRSRFSAMTTQAEYVALKVELSQLSRSYNIKLRPEDP